MKYLKYFLAVLLLYLIIFISIIIPSFQHIKESLTQKHLKENSLIVDNFMIKIEPVLRDHKYTSIKEYMENFVASNIIDHLDIKYTNYYITVNNLLQNSNNIKTKNWVLNDVTMDIKYGQIEKFGDIAYKFIPAKDYNHAIRIEKKIKSMKSSIYIRNISNYPELLEKLVRSTLNP